MHANEDLIKELKIESAKSREMLDRLPDDKFSWRPHPRSMSLGELASHLAELPYYVYAIFSTHDYDVTATNFTPSVATTHDELLELYTLNHNMAIDALEEAEEDVFDVPWIMRVGEHVVLDSSRRDALRTVVLSHLIHHRGQLSVYMRMLDIPLPRIYGPTADE